MTPSPDTAPGDSDDRSASIATDLP